MDRRRHCKSEEDVMDLDIDSFLMVGAVSIGVYFAGYTGIGIALFAITIVFTFVGGGFKKKLTPKERVVQGLRVQGAEVLEPIVVKTTRDAPFRIPERMDIRIKPNWSAPTMYEKAARGISNLTNPVIHGLKGEIKNI